MSITDFCLDIESAKFNFFTIVEPLIGISVDSYVDSPIFLCPCSVNSTLCVISLLANSGNGRSIAANVSSFHDFMR